MFTLVLILVSLSSLGKGPCEQLVSPEPEIHMIERIKDKDQMVRSAARMLTLAFTLTLTCPAARLSLCSPSLLSSPLRIRTRTRCSAPTTVLLDACECVLYWSRVLVRAQIVLACDGIWDVMSNEELCEYLLDRLRVSSALDEICRNCLDTCLHKVLHYKLLYYSRTVLDAVQFVCALAARVHSAHSSTRIH